MLSFAQAGRRLHEAAIKIQEKREISYEDGLREAGEKDIEAALIYFEPPKMRRQYIETPAQADKKKRGKGPPIS